METKEKITAEELKKNSAIDVQELTKERMTFVKVVGLEKYSEEYQNSDKFVILDGTMYPQNKRIVLRFKPDSPIFYDKDKYYTDVVCHVKEPAYIKKGMVVRYGDIIAEPSKTDKISGFGVFVKHYEHEE